jgi:hypothetical protein
MTNRKTSLARVPTAFPAKRGRGRKPAGESNAAECRDRITSWKLTPESKRQPPTLTALAAELGISKQLASYHLRQAPESIGALIENIERDQVARRYSGVVETMGRMAEEGHPEMAKLFMRQIIEPRRPVQQNQNSMITDLKLLQAVKLYVHPAEPQTVLEAKPVIIENGAVGQIK